MLSDRARGGNWEGCHSGSGNATKLKTIMNSLALCNKESVYQFSVKFVNFYYILIEKSAETAMVFYKSAPSAAAATPLNQKE